MHTNSSAFSPFSIRFFASLLWIPIIIFYFFFILYLFVIRSLMSFFLSFLFFFLLFFSVGCRVTVNEIYRRTAGVQAEEASMSHELLSSIFITMSDSLSRPLISLHFWPIRGATAAAPSCHDWFCYIKTTLIPIIYSQATSKRH